MNRPSSANRPVRPGRPNWWHKGIQWLEQSTFTPTRLPGWCRHQWVGYLTTLLLMTLFALIALLLKRTFPTIEPFGILEFCPIALVTLAWGIRPGFFAVCLGDFEINDLLHFPNSSWSLNIPSATANALFLGVGLLISGGISELGRAYYHARSLATELTTEHARLEAILASAPDGIVVYDQRGIVTHLNPAAEHLLGITNLEAYTVLAPHEQWGLHRPRILGLDNHSSSDSFWQIVATGEEVKIFDMWLRTLDKREILVNACCARVRNTHGQIVGGVYVERDVTALRRLEQRTRASLEALLKVAEVLVHLPDESRNTLLHQTILVNEAVQELATLTLQVIGCERVEIIAIDPETGHLTPMALAEEQSEVDISWWQELRQHLLQEYVSPQQVEQLQSGQIVRIPPKDAGTLTMSLVAPISLQQKLIGLLCMKYAQLPHEFLPEEYSLEATIAQLVALVMEREHLLQQRTLSQARELALRETNQRMEAFLGIVAHELRTPLTTIKVSLQMALRLLNQWQEHSESETEHTISMLQRVLKVADHQAERQTRFVADMLTISQIQTDHFDLRPQKCDLVSIVGKTVEDQSILSPNRLIHWTSLVDTAEVLADADRVNQVVTNYLSNALKYFEKREAR